MAWFICILNCICIHVVTTLRMDTGLAETCWWPLYTKITYIKRSESVGPLINFMQLCVCIHAHDNFCACTQENYVSLSACVNIKSFVSSCVQGIEEFCVKKMCQKFLLVMQHLLFYSYGVMYRKCLTFVRWI